MPDLVGASARQAYEEVMRATRPVFYASLQGSKMRELVRGVAGTLVNAPQVAQPGPFPGAQSIRFSASTADNDGLTFPTDTTYHPGDTFSVAGWFNRQGVGSSPILFSLHVGDFVVYIPTGDKLTLRKSGTADIWATNATFPSPYTQGWQHCVFTKATTTTIAYLNGILAAGTGSNQTIVASTTDPTLGITATLDTSDFDGSLAHWAVWNRVLTAAEVSTIYLAGRNAT